MYNMAWTVVFGPIGIYMVLSSPTVVKNSYIYFQRSTLTATAEGGEMGKRKVAAGYLLSLIRGNQLRS